MTSKTFDDACNRLALMLDEAGHEKRRFAREEGAHFKNVVSIVEEIFAQREEYSVTSHDQPKDADKATVLMFSLSGSVVGQLTVRLDRETVSIWPVSVAGSKAIVSTQWGLPKGIKFADISKDTVEVAVADAMNHFVHQ